MSANKINAIVVFYDTNSNILGRYEMESKDIQTAVNDAMHDFFLNCDDAEHFVSMGAAYYPSAN